jgi:two-component system cell cycle sensor histidine kinase PleC
LLKSAEDALAITALLTAPERKRARETSEIRAIVDDACAFVAPDLAASAIALAIDVKGDEEIVGDHQATRQMLINLVAEASRRAAPGAVLRIETKAVSEAVHLSLSLIGGVNVQPEDGFGIILARTFCELSGAELTSSVTESGEWTASVRLQRAAQPDLFAAAA